MPRFFFVSKDSLEVGGYLHAVNYEGNVVDAVAAGLAIVVPAKMFAGIVCVKDPA
eukprot:SAG22_NODE_237_length_14221_cov_37.207832_7_plen_55_part_00